MRTARDWAQYTRPAYQTASKLHRRAVERLFRELGTSLTGEAPPLAAGAGARVRGALAYIERAIPSDALHEEFLDRHRPDVLLVTPGLHFGSGQTDYVKAARARGVPVWMLLFSWDNLSTKGALHALGVDVFEALDRFALRGRVVHEHVDAAEALDRVLYEAFAGGVIGDVARER